MGDRLDIGRLILHGATGLRARARKSSRPLPRPSAPAPQRPEVGAGSGADALPGPATGPTPGPARGQRRQGAEPPGPNRRAYSAQLWRMSTGISRPSRVVPVTSTSGPPIMKSVWMPDMLTAEAALSSSQR